MIYKEIGEPRLVLESLDHRGFLDGGYATIRQRFRRGNSMGLIAETTVSKKLTRFQDSDGRLPALLGSGGDVRASFLQVEDRVGIRALTKANWIFCTVG